MIGILLTLATYLVLPNGWSGFIGIGYFLVVFELCALSLLGNFCLQAFRLLNEKGLLKRLKFTKQVGQP